MSDENKKEVNGTDEIVVNEEDNGEVKKEVSQEKQKPVNNYIELDEPTFTSCEDYVNNKRKDFDVIMKHGKKVSMIMTGSMLTLLVVAFVLSSTLGDSLKWISYVVFGIVLVGIIISLFFTAKDKKKTFGSVDDYVIDVIYAIDKFAFSTNHDLTNIRACKGANMELSDITEAHYFDTINAINSRNVVIANLNGKELKCGEIACRVPYQTPVVNEEQGEVPPTNNKKQPTESYGIFGKYFCYPIALANGAAVIITMKGTNFCSPTYLDNYVGVNVPALNSSFSVYSTNEKDASELFDNQELVDILNSFKSDEVMENLFISINDNGLKICLNYNESLMEIPMQKDVVGTPYVHFANDVDKVVKFINIISK